MNTCSSVILVSAPPEGDLNNVALNSLKSNCNEALFIVELGAYNHPVEYCSLLLSLLLPETSYTVFNESREA